MGGTLWELFTDPIKSISTLIVKLIESLDENGTHTYTAASYTAIYCKSYLPH